jgi:hypothetical protein
VLFADGAQYKRNDNVEEWAPELNGEAWTLCPTEKPQAKACATGTGMASFERKLADAYCVAAMSVQFSTHFTA